VKKQRWGKVRRRLCTRCGRQLGTDAIEVVDGKAMHKTPCATLAKLEVPK
jgi:hypothetical protein